MVLFRLGHQLLIRAHYSANAFVRKGGVLGTLALAGLGVFAGCAGGAPFFAFESQVTRREKLPSGAMETTFRGVDRVVVGPGYLRITTVPEKEGPVVTRIYDRPGGTYGELIEPPGGKPTARWWPLEELAWRLEESFIEARRETRRAFGRLPPLVRPVQWKYFSGDQREVFPQGGAERVLDTIVRKNRIAAFPGTAWDVWIGEETALPAAQGALLFVAEGLPPERAASLMRRVGTFPLSVEAVSWDGASELRHHLRAWPSTTAVETADAVVPAGLLAQARERDSRLGDPLLLLGILDGVEEDEADVTPLGAAVRLSAHLSRQTVTWATRRFAVLKDRSARRYIMDRAMRTVPDIAIPLVKKLLDEGSIPVAQDAAFALSRVLPREDAVRAVAAVLKRAWRMDPRSSEVDVRDRGEVFLWAADLLGELSGCDMGYWPGEDEERAIVRWITYAASLGEARITDERPSGLPGAGGE
jgi:hypothetical protein